MSSSSGSDDNSHLPSAKPSPPPKRTKAVEDIGPSAPTSIVAAQLPTSKPQPPKKKVKEDRDDGTTTDSTPPPLPPFLPTTKPAAPPSKRVPASENNADNIRDENQEVPRSSERRGSHFSHGNPMPMSAYRLNNAANSSPKSKLANSDDASSSGASSSTTADVRNPFDDVDDTSIDTHRNTFAPSSTSSVDDRASNASGQLLQNKASSTSSGQLISYGLKSPGQPGNPIYYLNRYSEAWLFLFLAMHIGQFAMLLTVGYEALSTGAFIVVTFLVVAVALLALASRFCVTKHRLTASRNLVYNNNQLSPADEADVVSDSAVYCLALAAVLEGLAYAIYVAVCSGNGNKLRGSGFFTEDTLLQSLRFASITLLCLHRILRPANRLDPMKTVLELEVVSVCWDALDGSTLYELLGDASIHISGSAERAIRVLMVAWYFSIGIRMALMMATHLSPRSKLQSMLITAPYQLAPQETVDRTLQGIRLRSVITLTMACADLFAGCLRIALWTEGKLTALQQDMCIKNMMFLMTIHSAVYNYKNSVDKIWNARDLLTYPFVLRYPRIVVQIELFRYFFVFSYLSIGAMMTSILLNVVSSSDALYWIANMAVDCGLVLLFVVYAKNAHIHDPIVAPSACFIPHKSFFNFPGYLALIFGVLMLISLMFFRLPALYMHYSSMDDDSSSNLQTYNNAMLLVAISAIPLFAYSSFWSLSYMLFRKEFTASPGNYNAIHDPTINMVNTAVMIEGALDILSSATLMQLATLHLPSNVNNAILLFCLLELINGCQSFSLPVLLSGGYDNTPKDQVRWNAYLRVSRGLIDFGTIVLRIVLWVQYGAVSSVFLVKNMYNLLYTGTQVDRWLGVHYYPEGTLFSGHVPPEDWYGMTREQFRVAILSHQLRRLANSPPST